MALKRCADAQPGEWVLVHGAAGGVGLAAVDYAKILGCKVIAASASDEKLAVIEREYDVDATVNVTRGFRERVKEITGGKGADVIYDPVGGDIFDESTRCIAFGGRILSIGFTSGRLPVLPVNIALIKGFSVHGVRAGEYRSPVPREGPREQRGDLEAGRGRSGEAPRRRRIPALRLARGLRDARPAQGGRQDGHPPGPVAPFRRHPTVARRASRGTQAAFAAISKSAWVPRISLWLTVG